MKEWTFEEAVKVITDTINKSQLAKDVELLEGDAEQLAHEIATALEESE